MCINHMGQLYLGKKKLYIPLRILLGWTLGPKIGPRVDSWIPGWLLGTLEMDCLFLRGPRGYLRGRRVQPTNPRVPPTNPRVPPTNPRVPPTKMKVPPRAKILFLRGLIRPYTHKLFPIIIITSNTHSLYHHCNLYTHLSVGFSVESKFVPIHCHNTLLIW